MKKFKIQDRDEEIVSVSLELEGEYLNLKMNGIEVMQFEIAKAMEGERFCIECSPHQYDFNSSVNNERIGRFWFAVE